LNRLLAILLLSLLGSSIIGCGEKKAAVPSQDEAAQQPPIGSPTEPGKSERSELPN